jgi:hypothetical protein
MILKLIDNGVCYIIFSLRKFVTLPEVLVQHLNQHNELKTHVKVKFRPRTRHEVPEGV